MSIDCVILYFIFPKQGDLIELLRVMINNLQCYLNKFVTQIYSKHTSTVKGNTGKVKKSEHKVVEVMWSHERLDPWRELDDVRIKKRNEFNP